MKKLSLIISSMVLFAGISYANPIIKQGQTKPMDKKATKKTEKKTSPAATKSGKKTTKKAPAAK